MGQAAVHKLDGHGDYDMDDGASKVSRAPARRQRQDRYNKPSFNERLKKELNKPCEQLEIGGEREWEREDDEKDWDIDRGPTNEV